MSMISIHRAWRFYPNRTRPTVYKYRNVTMISTVCTQRTEEIIIVFEREPRATGVTHAHQRGGGDCQQVMTEATHVPSILDLTVVYYNCTPTATTGSVYNSVPGTLPAPYLQRSSIRELGHIILWIHCTCSFLRMLFWTDTGRHGLYMERVAAR